MRTPAEHARAVIAKLANDKSEGRAAESELNIILVGIVFAIVGTLLKDSVTLRETASVTPLNAPELGLLLGHVLQELSLGLGIIAIVGEVLRRLHLFTLSPEGLENEVKKIVSELDPAAIAQLQAEALALAQTVDTDHLI